MILGMQAKPSEVVAPCTRLRTSMDNRRQSCLPILTSHLQAQITVLIVSAKVREPFYWTIGLDYVRPIDPPLGSESKQKC